MRVITFQNFDHKVWHKVDWAHFSTLTFDLNLNITMYQVWIKTGIPFKSYQANRGQTDY